MELKSVCLEAHELTNGARRESYGHPLDDYTRTVAIFKAITGHDLTVEDGLMFMVCVKLSRQQHKPKRDNIVDAIGYLDCIPEAEEERKRRASG